MPPALTAVRESQAAEDASTRWVFDPAGMSEVLAEQWPPLVRLAALLLGGRAPAEDVVQDVCEATWRSRPAIRDREHLVAYLRAGVVNRCRSAGRRRSTAARYLTLVTPSAGSAEHGPAADVPMLAAERREEVIAALAQLTGRQREVLVLRYWADLSEAQIAEALSISRGTVKSTAHHALHRLATLLGATP